MKIGLLITTYNRPNYLRKCLESISMADMPYEMEILISDDASTDKETIDMINGTGYTVIFSKKNGSIKQSLVFGCDFLFNTMGCDVVTNLDADAIVSKDFLTRLIDLKLKFHENIITGFNCRTKNRNGSERHIVVKEGEGFNIKRSVGGINMLFDLRQYNQFIKPALIESLAFGGNWDHMACIKSEIGGHQIVCAVPSVVQHIGVESSMGHSAGGEPPDVADDFINSIKKKLHLPDVTLVGADCVDVDRLIRAIDISCQEIEFGAVKILSSKKSNDPRVVKIRDLPTKGDYSVFMMKELANYINTKYLLVIQYDGFVLNHLAWDNDWLNYDYIGAPWEWYTDGMNVGNGGFSLRSKKIMQITANDKDIFPVNEYGVTKHMEEDHCICRIYRKYIEHEYKLKFAPIEVARKFSIEAWNSPNKTWTNEFGFHGRHVDISKSNQTI